MSASTSVGDLTGNQLCLAEVLGVKLEGLKRGALDTRELRVEAALRIRGLQQGSRVKYPGIQNILFITKIEAEEIVLSQRSPLDSESEDASSPEIRVQIERFLRYFRHADEDGGITWA